MRQRPGVVLAVMQTAVLVALAGDGAVRPDLWSDRYQYNFRWASPSGIDLNSEVAIQARSYVETAFLVGAGQKDVVAVGERMGIRPYYSARAGRSSLPKSLSLQFDDRAGDRNWTIRGTVYASLEHVELYRVVPSGGTATGDDPSDSWWMDVRICVWGTGLAYGDKDGEFYSGKYAALRSGRLWVAFGLPAGGQAAPEARISGPARYPTRDYFGDWITLMPDTYTPDVKRGSKPESCRLPAEFPVTLDPGDYAEKPSVRVPPPEVLPPYPGWPE